MMQKEFYTYNILQELKAMNELISERYGADTKIFIVTDTMGTVAAQDFMSRNQERITAIYDLATIPEYKTPGFGIICQSDILTASMLKQSRDKDGFYTKYIVMQTKKEIFKARNK